MMVAMKITRLMQLVCVNVFVAGSALAAAPQVGADAPLSLCGEKAESAKKDEKGDTVVKSDKKDEKKDSKDKTTDSKDSA
jgi:hypothetical protein